MDNKSTWKGDEELIFVTDQQGNTYLVSRDVLKQGAVPPEKKAWLDEAIHSEVKGYGDDYMVKLANQYFGQMVAKYDDGTKQWVYDNGDLEKLDVNQDHAIGVADLMYWMNVK